MAINRDQNGPHVFQGETGAPAGYKAVVAPAFSMVTTIDDIKRHLLDLHRCGLWHKCLHADLWDGYHVDDFLTYLATLYQPLDADLTALAALSTTGIMVRTAAATYAMRTLASGTGLLWSNADGVSGNPSVALNLTALTADTPVAADEFFFYDVGGADYNKVTLANLATALGVPASALADPGSNGIVVRTALNTTTARTLTASATAGQEGATVSNGDGVSGNPTVGVTINGLTADTPVGADSMAFYDAGEGANNKCTVADLNAAMDHGVLAGLGDDDHTQYHNDARGDARYLQKSNNLSDLADDDTAISNLVGGGNNRTPTETHDLPIRDPIGSNHGKASIAAIKQDVVTADNTLIQGIGQDKTDGPWKDERSKDFTTGGAGATETLMDIPIPTNSQMQVTVEIISVAAANAGRGTSYAAKVRCENNGGTCAVGTAAVYHNEADGATLTVSYSVSTTNLRISVADDTAVIRVAAFVTRMWRTTSA